MERNGLIITMGDKNNYREYLARQEEKLAQDIWLYSNEHCTVFAYSSSVGMVYVHFSHNERVSG